MSKSPRSWADIAKEFEAIKEEKPEREDLPSLSEPKRLETFPGSKTPIPDPSIPRKSDADEPLVSSEWRKMGKTYLLNGESVKLYQIGAMAAALNRSSATIRSWERKGFFSTPPLRGKHMGHGGRRRLYTEEQIEKLILIAMEEGILHPTTRIDDQGILRTDFPHIKHTKFAERVRDFFATQKETLTNS